MNTFLYYFIIFIIYSFFGYIIEIISVFKNTHKITLSRGYLIGPVIPIFGFGAISSIFLLEKYQSDYFALFFLGAIIGCSIEYFTSYLLEKIYHLRWWDYSNRKYNINGRVCLENGIYFGIGGILVIEVINPFIEKLLSNFDTNIIIIISTVILIIFLVDFLISTYMLLELKLDIKDYSKKDSTNIIKDEILVSLEKQRFFHRRTLKAFPNMIDIIDIKEFNKVLLKKR